MTLDGRAIAVMFCLQGGSVIVFHLGGRAGARIMHKLHEGFSLPSAIAICVALGLWPLLIPAAWTALAFRRARQEAPYWEMLLWFGFAAAFFVVMSGWGLIAAIIPLVVIIT